MKSESGGMTLSGVVRDVYGREIGKLVGVVLDLDGSIKSIGVSLGEGRFAQYALDRIVEKDHDFVVAPEWKVEIRSLVREREALRKRLALEAMARGNEANPKIVEEMKQKLQEVKSRQNGLKEKMEVRLDELNANFEELGEFEAMMKLQRATAEIDDRVFQVASDYCESAISADAREKDDLRRAIGFLENVEEAPMQPAPPPVPAPQLAPKHVKPARREQAPIASTEDFPEFRLTPTAFRMPDPSPN